MLKSPILLHYYITFKCNCRCTFCNIWSKQTLIPYARLNEVFQNLADAKRLGVKFVDFTGGEPLLHPHLDKLLAKAKTVGLRTSLTTNCLLYPGQAKKLAGKIDYLHFSLDALDEDLHNNTRGQDCYSSVMQSIDIALGLGEKPDLLFTVTEKTISQLPLLVQFAEQVGLLLIVNPVFFYFENQAAITTNEWDQITAIKSPNIYVNKALIRLHQTGGNDITNPRCRVVDSCIIISPENEMILPCYHYFHKRLVICSSLTKMRQSREVIEFKKRQGREDNCKGCKLNCYFDPSFMYKLDGYFIKSMQAKAKYFINKKYLFKNKRPQQPAKKIAQKIYADEKSLHPEQKTPSPELKQCA